MRWTHIAGRNSCATSGGCADGEVVWSWRSDAGAKLAKTLTRLADDGGKKAWSPERARISRKTIAQGRPDDPPVPVVLPRAFFSARGPWVRWTPGLPCALLISRAACFQQLGHFRAARTRSHASLPTSSRTSEARSGTQPQAEVLRQAGTPTLCNN